MKISKLGSLPPKSRPFPTMSILALVFIPLLAFLSWPFWAWYVGRQIKIAASECNFSPDPGQFGGFAIIGAVVMTGTFAAFLGLGITWCAGRRNERWRAVRMVAWVVNGLGTLLGGALLVSYLMK